MPELSCLGCNSKPYTHKPKTLNPKTQNLNPNIKPLRFRVWGMGVGYISSKAGFICGLGIRAYND